ncbi:retrotransposon protein, putative, ty1-copia subclass [Tanacetum coccineum]
MKKKDSYLRGASTLGDYGKFKKLENRGFEPVVGNGHRAAVEAIGTYHLELPSGLVIVLNNCHYAPFITRDSSLLWHCRLGHISKKRIEKLQHDGLLNYIDIESLGKCVSCLSGKMARKPYSHQVERAKDLLGLIHTDVCGPFRIVSRQGANYFVTFTDDFSRYGYVYLLKHKHEVFKTFKVFQKEVENQLGKTIKSLRSDRGGEYMSQEFLDHLKEHGIIAHRTPPYTPQNNGVSERRNQTLLDMVRSMMSQTTLPKSFWDYALETAARILNMVPTKEGDKTPYEIWHGQAPKLSYFKVWDLKASGSVEDLELIQEEDTNPSVDTSLNHEEDDQEIDEPQSDINPIRRSTRTRRPTDRLCLYIDAENMKFRANLSTLEYKNSLAYSAYYDYEDMAQRMDVKNRPSSMDFFLGSLIWSNLRTGYVFVLNGGVVDWKTTKQSIIATSSTDAEYIAAFDASKEAVWIRKFISGLGIVPTIEEPISMYCDNTGAIAIAKDDGVTKGARHFRAKVHYLRETIKMGDVKIEKIDTDDNLADPFTKALAFPKHSELTRNIGLLPASSFM